MKESRQERRAREREEERERKKVELQGPVVIHEPGGLPRGFGLKVLLGISALLLLAWPILKRGGSDGDPPRDVLRAGLADLEERVQQVIADGRRAVARDPESSAAWGRLGALFDAHGLDEDALRSYARARELDGDEFRWWYLAATVTLRSGFDPEESERLFAAALERDDDYVPLFWRRGSARFERGDEQGARADLQRALSLDPEFGHAQRELGNLELSVGDASAALLAFQGALETLENDAAVHAGLSRAYALLDRPEDSEFAAVRAAALQPAGDAADPLRLEVEALGVSSALASGRADALFQMGEFGRALDQLAIVAEARPDDGRVQVRIGLCHQRLGDLLAAERSFSRATQVDPQLADGWRELGRVVSARGNAELGLQHLSRALELAPEDGSIQAKRGLSLHRLGRIDESLAAFSSAESLGGLAADDWVNWAVVLTSQQRHDDARAKLEAALVVNPVHPKAHYGLGFVAERQERYTDAVRSYGLALDADPDYGEAHLNLGLLHERLEQGEQALVHLQRAEYLLADSKVGPRIRALEERLARRGSTGAGAGSGEFGVIARRLSASDQKYLGRAQYEDLKAKLEGLGLSADRRIDLLAELAREALEHGDVDQAVSAVEEQARSIAMLPGRKLRPADQRLAAICYLRQAELQNCVMLHNADCCIFPLRGGGVHLRREPAHKALGHYLAYLEAKPSDLSARWLANVAAMALGEHPEAVPERWRLEPDLFRSDETLPRFRDIAPGLGLASFNLCGGTVVDDFNGDGLLDIITSSYAPDEPLRYFQNGGLGGFADRSEAAGLELQLGGLNLVGADADGDGDVDLFVLRGAWLLDHGRIRNSLLLNDGRGKFTDVTRAAGLASPAAPTQAACFADFDSDGDLDIYVANESRAAFESTGNYPSQLFMNRGEGKYIDFAKAAGVTNDRYAKGVCAGDADGDGDPDLYVSNNGPNRLYENHGDKGFVDIAPERGMTEPSGRSFACWFFDYDNDGDLDLFVGAFKATIGDLCAAELGEIHQAEKARLYRNDGSGQFEDVAGEVGLDGVYLPMGANFGDVDGDGFEDIYLATGDPDYETLMPNVLLKNVGGERFVDATTSAGLGHLQKGHGVAFADIDQDGDLDLYHQLGGFYPGDGFANALFENPGPAKPFVVIELVGKETNRQGIGARVEVRVSTPTGVRSIHRAAGAVSSFGGSPRRMWIGLGDAEEILEILVDWPISRKRQLLPGIELGALVRIHEDRPQPEILSYEVVPFRR